MCVCVFLMCASASFLPAGGWGAGRAAPALLIAASFKVATPKPLQISI